MKGRALLLGILLIAAVLLPSAASEKRSIEELREEADAVLGLVEVSARGRIDVVFELADRLKEAGQTEEALHYYETALRNNPWALNYQLAFAELLKEQGSEELAQERLRIVSDYAEQDELVVKARHLLGEDVDISVPPIGRIEDKEHAVVFVPLGEVDILLVKEVAQALEKELGIPVVLQEVEMRLPPPGRGPLKEMLHQLRYWLKAREDREQVQGLLAERALSLDDLEDDYQALLDFYKALAERSHGKEAAEQFSELVDQLSGRSQWDADELLNVLKASVRDYAQEGVVHIGITGKDVYARDYNFLFGWTRRGAGVLSYSRFTAEFTGETPNRDRLGDRILKQSFSSTGLAFGIPRCSNPTCPRAYPHSLSEHDAKSTKLCDACKEGFRQKFGQE